MREILGYDLNKVLNVPNQFEKMCLQNHSRRGLESSKL